MASWNIYDQVRDFLIDPTTAAISGTFKCALLTAAYTIDQNLHDFWDDVSANEVSGTNYTADGNACASITVTMDGAGLVTFDCDDPATWLENAGGFSNARYAILYWDTGTPSTSRLLAYSSDFGTDRGNTGGDFSINMDASGVFTNAR